MKADSRFTWFRMYSEVLSDRKVDRAASISGLSRMEILGAWTGLLCLASDSPVRGVLLLTETMPLTTAEIAEYVGTDTETLDIALDAFERLGMLALDGDGVYSVCQWSGRQYESDTSTERVRKFRGRKGEQTSATVDVQPVREAAQRSGNVTVTPQIRVRSESESEKILPPGGGAPAPEAPKRQPSDAARRLGELERVFAERTGHVLPLRDTDAQRKAAGTLWWNPLREILQLCDNDVGRATSLDTRL